MTDERAPAQLFNAYEMADPDTKKRRVGGAYDGPTAVQIACAWFQARQDKSTGMPELLVGVFDEADTAVAFIGTE